MHVTFLLRNIIVYEMGSTVLQPRTRTEDSSKFVTNILNPTLHSNFEASQLCQEPFIGSILHLNLVTWVPVVTLTKKVHQKIFCI